MDIKILGIALGICISIMYLLAIIKELIKYCKIGKMDEVFLVLSAISVSTIWYFIILNNI